MEDQTAISLVKQGNLKGLEELVMRYQRQAVHSAYLILQDRNLAEEVAQNAFLKVYEKIHQFSDGKPFQPWLMKIIIHDAIKVAHAQKRWVSLDAADDPESAALAFKLIDPHPLPEQQLEIKQDRESIRNALNLLTPEQRASVMMRYYLELSESQIARELNRPISTIKWLLRAARRRISLILQPASSYRE